MNMRRQYASSGRNLSRRQRFTGFRDKFHVIPFILIVVVSMHLFVPSVLGETKEQHDARRLRIDGTILSLEYFIEQAKKLHPGRVIAANLDYESIHEKYVYEIEVLDFNGEVWELEYDAHSGRLIEKGKGVDVKGKARGWDYKFPDSSSNPDGR